MSRRSVSVLPITLFSLAATAALCGCATRAGTGAVVGSGFGAVAGTMIGHAVGNPGGGALIGAGTGALVGGAFGEAEDAREQRDLAIAHAHAAENQLHELHNGDLIRMSQSGLGDDVIIGAVQSRGGRFDLGPDGLIALKANGVSDAVIVAVQQGSSAITPVSVIDPPLAPVVVVPPRRPSVGVVIGVGGHRRYGPRPRFHHHHGWHH